MAISKNRKGHAEKVREAYELIVAARLEDGQSRKGFLPKRKLNLTPYRNPERLTRLSKKAKRQKKAQARLARRKANA